MLNSNTRGKHYQNCWCLESESEVTQSCPTLHDLTDCSLPGFSVHRIFQARILEWVAISFSLYEITLPNRAQCFSTVSFAFSLINPLILKFTHIFSHTLFKEVICYIYNIPLLFCLILHYILGFVFLFICIEVILCAINFYGFCPVCTITVSPRILFCL